MGGVAEWTMATVLKTVNPQGFVGSNPTPSAMFFVPETPAESAAATGDYEGALRALTDAGFKTVTDDSLIVHLSGVPFIRSILQSTPTSAGCPTDKSP